MVLAATEDDIVAGVRFARDMNLRVTVRAGLHNLGGFSFVQGGVVIDLRRMRTITVDTSNAVITFQGGIRFGDLDAKLWNEHPGEALTAPGSVLRAPPIPNGL
jgi:FAD/FMN-containing dehydrogenase